MPVWAERMTVGLCMIVKNEATVIRRCLDSCRPLIDTWTIVDTGSNDDTAEIVVRWADDAGITGKGYQRPWKNFAANRSEALALARAAADYTLIIDADDTFAVDPGFRYPVLDRGAYTIPIMHDGMAHWRIQMVSNRLPWRYEGVVHEFLACDEAWTCGALKGVTMEIHSDGARRRTGVDAYRQDAALLEEALAGNISPFLRSRYEFYLAQSYRDCGEKAKAVEHYLKRAEFGHWDQEIYFSLFTAGLLMEELGRPLDEVRPLYERAMALCPMRVEATWALCKLLRAHGHAREAFAIGLSDIGKQPPVDGLFVLPWIYERGLAYEVAQSAAGNA